MCGIVGAIAQRPIAALLLEGLKALEYRGYDSAGVALLENGVAQVVKTAGKVAALEAKVKESGCDGHLGIAHTRWATHGKATEVNAHPHQVGNVILVHNGIIENYQELKKKLSAEGYSFKSETDTEVLAALIHYYQHRDLKPDSSLKIHTSKFNAFNQALNEVQGTYGVAMIDSENPDTLYVARSGSPLVVGCGIGENFVASDIIALLPVTSKFIYLEDGDRGIIGRDHIMLFDRDQVQVKRAVQSIQVNPEILGKGPYKHYMQKEIFEQPEALRNTLMGRLADDNVSADAFVAQGQDHPQDFLEVLKDIEHIEMVACGTSYHAALVGKYLLEEHAGVSTNVTIASEYRYKRTIVPPKSLFVTLSQSGETADTIAALELAQSQGYSQTLAICNVDNSSLVRMSQYVFLTRAGREIGVASTKAFTTQLLALMLLTIALGRGRGEIDANTGASLINALHQSPAVVQSVLKLDAKIEQLSLDFVGKEHTLFLGRGPMYPIALEGALKLKEISYIHAEGYASGELKHGPIALIDSKMPVIVVAPDNIWLPKLISNIEEVKARGGKLYIFSGKNFGHSDEATMFDLGTISPFIAPIAFTIPLQLLAYHVAVINGTDVDQPRNLAKSVTVE